MTEGVFIYYVLYNCCVFNFLSLKNKKKEKKEVSDVSYVYNKSL